MKSINMVIFISVVLFLYASPGLSQTSTSKAYPQQTELISWHNKTTTDYNLSTSRFGRQFGSGVLFGAAGVFLGGFTGYAASGFKDDLSSLPSLFLGSSVGYLIGTSSGIYFAADSGLYNASFGYILIGNIVGIGVGISGAFLTESTFDNKFPRSVSVGIAVSSTIIGGILANSLSIKKRSSQSAALLNFSGDHSHLAVPSMKFTKISHMNSSNFGIRNSYSPTVKLLNISL